MARRSKVAVSKNKVKGRIIAGIFAVLLLGLLVTGMSQTLGQSNELTTTGNPSNGVADPETRYLGQPTDPEGLTQAEAGLMQQPTLVWFHADWCHVCQQVKPEVIDLGQAFEGKVKFIRLNVDDPASRSAIQRYGVRATPTFVLLDDAGRIRGNVPGWPGYQAFVDAFDQLLTQT